MRLIASSGGALAANLSDAGCGGARWRESRARAGEAERQRGRVKSGAPRAQQMKAGAWKRWQAVVAVQRASPAHGRHAAVAPWRGRDATRENGVAQRWGRPDAGAGLGQTRGARAAGAAAGRAGFGRGLRKEAATRERRKAFFNFLFSRKFQIAVFKYPFEQENYFF